MTSTSKSDFLEVPNFRHTRSDLLSRTENCQFFRMETGRKRRSVPGSRRERRQRKKEEQTKRFKASPEPVRDFSASHSGDDELKRVMEQAFRECGEVILRQLTSLYGPDPDGAVAAARQGKLLVQMGLVSPESFASAFGGSLSLMMVSLDELRELAKQAGMNAYSMRNEAGGRQRLTIGALQNLCRPLIFMSPEIYKATYPTDTSQMLQILRELECLPGKDELVERELNRRMRAYRVDERLPRTFLYGDLALPLHLLADGHSDAPIAHRPSLAKRASDLWRAFKHLPPINDQVAFSAPIVRRHVEAEESIRRDIFLHFDAPRRVWPLRR